MQITHAKVNEIPDITQAQLDQYIAAGYFAPGTTLADISLASDWNDPHTIAFTGTANQYIAGDGSLQTSVDTVSYTYSGGI